jgi:hypothetical protein
MEAEGIGAVRLRGFGLYRLRNTAIELANHSHGISPFELSEAHAQDTPPPALYFFWPPTSALFVTPFLVDGNVTCFIWIIIYSVIIIESLYQLR